MRYRPLVYVAGAISDPKPSVFLTNIRKGIGVSAQLVKFGFAVFSPFLNYQFSFFEDLTYEDYIESDLAFLSVCNFLYVLKDWQNSKGTKGEIAEAIELNMPIFYQANISPRGLMEYYLGLYGDNIKEGKTAWR